MNDNVIKNFSKLNVQTQLLFLLIICADNKGEVRLKKDDFAEYLKTSRQTIGAHLKTFANCNLIKYKYCGILKINPEFYCNVKDDKCELENVKEEYARFYSDI